MFRNDLNDYCQYEFENEYYARFYEPRDMSTWINIQAISHPELSFNKDIFEAEFNHQIDMLKSRMIFVCDQHKREIGTATAWFKDDNIGMIHWVAILPEFQGRGLSKPLITLVLDLMKKCNHKSCILKTLPSKIIAINLYLQFGFEPSIQTNQDLKKWQSIKNVFEQKNIDTSQITKAIRIYEDI
jgi:ribosomal protein S18 acetylase RimI-like enzyme